MEIIKPENVLSPRDLTQNNVEVIYDGGEGSYSLALVDGSTGIRWNGSEDKPKGNPTSRGYATWFILPDAIAQLILSSDLHRGNKHE